MKNSIQQTIILFLALAAVILHCSVGPNNVAGGASDVELSKRKVFGCAVDTTGNPLENVVVRLRLQTYLADSSNSAEFKKIETVVNLLTDSLGCYHIDSLDTGKYIIELNMNDVVGDVVECSIDQYDDSIYVLDTDTLRPLAIISGQVNVVYDDTTSLDSLAQIQVYGLERNIRPDKAGKFSIKVPRGKHRLRVGARSMDYDKIELGLEIHSGKHKDIGKVIVHRNPLPKPPCFGYNCDSLVVRKILDRFGHDTISVESVTNVNIDGRISELHLRGLHLSEKTKELSKLSELEVLDLGDNDYYGKLPFTKHMSQLRILRLDNNHLTELGGHFESFFNLEELDVSNNMLSQIPNFLRHLTPYIKLDLSNNQICDTATTPGTQWADLFDPDWRETQQCDSLVN